MKNNKEVPEEKFAVLIVDSCEATRNLVTTLLEGETDCLSVAVSDTEAALKLCEAIRFDLVMTGFGPGAMSIKEFSDRLSKRIPEGYGPKRFCVMARHSDLPKVELTGPNDQKIPKPISRYLVASAIIAARI